jgi:hypothetical protein
VGDTVVTALLYTMPPCGQQQQQHQQHSKQMTAKAVLQLQGHQTPHAAQSITFHY